MSIGGEGTGSETSTTQPFIGRRPTVRDPRDPRARESGDCPNIDDLELRSFFLIGRTFASRDKGSIDHMMEKMYGRQRYQHMRGAFQRVSVLLALGCWVPAIMAATSKYWLRFALYGGLVSPMYSFYTFVASRRNFEQVSGSRKEALVIVGLVLQTAAIVLAEYARPRADYGMLVMHFSFIHNFTPLSTTIMNLVTIIFGMLPFLGLKLLRYFHPHPELPSKTGPTVNKKFCIETGGEADLVIGMLTPAVLLLFQTFVTMRRSASMRQDFMNQERMKAQQKQLDFERACSEDMLRSMLPREIIRSLKKNEPVDAQPFDSVTVIFIEICHFDELCSELDPELVVEILNVLYLEFDRLSDLLRVYKVETVGQVYMAVVGCPEPIVNHADVAAHFGLSCTRSMDLCLRDRIKRIRVKAEQTPRQGLHRGVSDSGMIQIRVGLNTGRLRAGVVGLDSPRYKLVGDTVNTASRMESTCEPGRVQASKTTMDSLTLGMFEVEERGEIEVKGKGKMKTYFLNGWTNPAMKEKAEVVIDRGWPSLQGVKNLRKSNSEISGRMGSQILNDELSGKFHQTMTSQTNGGLEDSSDDGAEGPCPQLPVTKLESGGFASALPALRAAFKRECFDHYEEGEAYTVHSGNLDGTSHKKMRMVMASSHRRFLQLHHWFLFVSPSYKKTDYLAKLAQDTPVYEESMLQSRMTFARNLTLVWLLMLSIVSAVDYYMDVIGTDVERYRAALVGRVVGNQVVGILYLLCLASPKLFRSYAQSISISMLIAQALALLTCAKLVYNNDPAIIALFGVYVSSYTVCTITQRLVICYLTVAGFAIVEIWRCNLQSAMDEAISIVFLVTLFSCIACGIRLEEFMDHVSHYEGRRISSRVEDIKINQALGNELLLSLLPSHVVPKVRDGMSPIAEHHPDVSIIFTDIKGFTQYSSQLSPIELMRFLNNMYSAFDEVILNWELYKVEIIGDAYFISAGCPKPSRGGTRQPHEWAMRAVEVALALLRTMPQVCDDPNVKMRVGVHTGPVVAGVVGKKGPRFHLFGPTVAKAEKMESMGQPSRVQISDETYEKLKDGGHEYECEESHIEEQGHNRERTWFVLKSNSTEAQKVARGLIVQRGRSGQKMSPGSS
jgi:class 3 adenylate cyclase